MIDEKAFREAFIKRLTVDSGHHDRRKKDYNQALFSWWSDDKAKDLSNTFQVWSQMNAGMVMECFDKAIDDVRGKKK